MKREKDTIPDEIDLKLIRLLQENARLTFKELGEAVHMSSTAAAERLRRLEEAGVIEGYEARVSAAALGRPITAYIRLRTVSEQYPKVLALLGELEGILECHHVTGDDSFLIEAALGSMGELEAVIARISPFGETSTALVMSTPLRKRI
jgi:Lrp/AsnC family transcriptional regulator, leucine-responsive regulatory protein